MKINLTLTVSFLLFSINVLAQKKKNNVTYNTRIDTAKNVVIAGGSTQILKADSVFIGQLIVNQKVEDSVYFLGSVTTYDSVKKIYTTNYKFSPKIIEAHFDVTISIEFDNPFVPYFQTLPPTPSNMIILGKRNEYFKVIGENGDVQVSAFYLKDLKGIMVRGIVMADALTLSVTSREKLFATISGVVGGKQ